MLKGYSPLDKDKFVGSRNYFLNLANENPMPRPNKTRLTTTLVGLGEVIKQKRPLSAQQENTIKEIFGLYEEFLSKFDLDEMSSGGGETILPRPTNELDRLVRLVLAYLHLDKENARMCERLLFEESAPDNIEFDTLRFSSEPGYVQRSITQIKRPNEKNPLVRFQNSFLHRGHRRSSRGVVLCFKRELAFIGTIDQGSGLKVMLLSEIDAPLQIYHGLLLSTDAGTGPIAARFAMRRLEDGEEEPNCDEPLPVGEIKSLYPEIIDSIRNDIAFKLEDPVFDQFGKPVTQRRLRSLVYGLLQSEDGSYLLSDEAGDVFNPTEHEHYTFNSALRWRN